MPENRHPVTVLSPSERHSILIHGILVFLCTGFLSVFAVSRLEPGQGYVPSESVSVPYFLAIFFIMTLALLAGLRIAKKGIVFEIFFTIAILSGAWFIADIFFTGSLPLLVGSAIILMRFAWKSVLSQNLTLIFGIAGISLAIGTDLSANAVLIVLTVLVFYDIVAVYKTRHMVRMFRDLVARGVLFAFALTPLKWRHLKASPTGEKAPSAMLLGTGDVALPAMLAVSAASTHLAHGIAVILGAAAGFALMYLLFLKQKKKHPMPALPPIALGSILAYFISIFIF